MNIKEQALELHRVNRGKIEVRSKTPIRTMQELSLAYTPGVAEPCKKISEDPASVYEYTAKGNIVAVVTDGTAVLGLGDIGPAAALPVMEGKAALFKEFAGIDAFPICIDSKDPDKIVETVTLIAPSFGGVNLEDISAPRCFSIEKRLKSLLDIPVMHDDQHGTAVVVLSALINALKVAGRTMGNIKAVMSGAGAAGTAIAKMILAAGVADLVCCDINGVVFRGRRNNDWALEDLASVTNRQCLQGTLADAMKGRDLFIGVSAPGIVTPEMVRSMNADPIVFAMANPVPEIMPNLAQEAGAKIVATGRSDFPNQVNNCLGFPGIFKGALSVRASDINEEMKLAAATAIASLVDDHERTANYIIPNAFDKRVVERVSSAVAEAARNSGVARNLP
ncbi:MAG: NAD-dependent malic enzyme [Deltaproteobacteria bacterium]|nr:NAD-dependent malic enzyme [Deltaproteobacteria bacterium]